MRDEAYAIPLLPASIASLTVDGANAIELNLTYLISLFPRFDAVARAASVGSLGYLELSEAGTAGAAFRIDSAIRINQLTVVVSGANLAPLSWVGPLWTLTSSSPTEWIFTHSTADFWNAADVQTALNGLEFRSTQDLDAAITLTAANIPVMTFTAIGPVALWFRGSATWALVENKELTWDSMEAAGLDWTALEGLRKNKK